jgi:hypothetical protein
MIYKVSDSCKVEVILSRYKIKWNLPNNFHIAPKQSDLINIHQVASEMKVSGWMDGQTWPSYKKKLQKPVKMEYER